MKFFLIILGILFSFLTALSALTPEQKKIINSYLDEAFNAYVDKDYETAMINFQKALQIDPSDEAALSGVKQCQKKLGYKLKETEKMVKEIRKLVRQEKWIEAIDHLATVSEIAAGQPPVLDLRTEIDTMLKKKVSQAAQDSAEQQLYQGLSAYLYEQYDQAIHLWEEVQKIVPDNVKIKIYIDKAVELKNQAKKYEILTQGESRAKAAFDAGNYEEAVQIWQQVLKLQPNNEHAKNELIKTQEIAEKKVKQNLIGEYYDKGTDFFAEGNYEESLRQWQNILTIDPKNEVAKKYIEKIEAKGVSILSSTDTQKESAIPIMPEPETTVPPYVTTPPPETLPKPKWAEKEKPSAPAIVSPNTELAPGSDQTLTPGIQLYKNGEYAAAIDFFQDYFEKNPNHAEPKKWLDKIKKEQEELAQKFYDRGLISYSKGDIENALREWQEGLKIHPNHNRTKNALQKVRGAR